MRYRDAAGSGTCYMMVTTNGFFRSAHDALGYLRVVDIPFILSYMAEKTAETFGDAEIYLPMEGPRVSQNTRMLLGMIDAALNAKTINNQELYEIQIQYNRTFRNTNPSVRFFSWGTIDALLKDKNFWSSVPRKYLKNEENYPETFNIRKLIKNCSLDGLEREHINIFKGFLKEVELN